MKVTIRNDRLTVSVDSLGAELPPFAAATTSSIYGRGIPLIGAAAHRFCFPMSDGSATDAPNRPAV